MRISRPADPAMRLSTESIHEALYRPSTRLLVKNDPSPLRTDVIIDEHPARALQATVHAA